MAHFGLYVCSCVHGVFGMEPKNDGLYRLENAFSKTQKRVSSLFCTLPDVFPSWRLHGLLAVLWPKTEKRDLSERLNWLSLLSETPYWSRVNRRLNLSKGSPLAALQP